MNKREIVLYYSDEINEDFSDIKKEPIVIDEKFKYFKNPVWRFFAVIVYRGIMTPFAYIYSKIKFKVKIVNKKVLKESKGKGAFVFGNHTLMGGDAFIPNIVTFPKKTFVIVNSANISSFGTKNFILMNGAIPLPTKTSGMRNFMNAIEKHISKKHAIVIYPEAHVWPYYTKIRDFKSVSFKYPVKLNAPCYCQTTTYQQRKPNKPPKVTVYVDGPFYPDKNIPEKEATIKLRNEIYDKMCERSLNSTYEYVKYVKKEETI